MSPFIPRLPRGVRRLFRLPMSRERMLRDMDDEVRHHFAMRVAELEALGLSHADAEAEAMRRFGDSDEFRAYSRRRADREARWRGAVEWLREWMQDVRFAHRQFGKNRAFTALAVLTLALGIGANTAIFTVVHRLLIAPLPYPNGDRLVMLMMDPGGNPMQASSRALKLWRSRARSLEMVGGVAVDAIYLQQYDGPDTIQAYVTSNYLDILGVRPVIGRAFTLADERPDQAAVAMISYGKWEREFGGRSSAIGATVHAGGHAYTIIGVAPRDVMVSMVSRVGVNDDLRQADPGIWIPSPLDSIDGANGFARLRVGVSADQASKELQAILASEPAPQQAGPFRAATCCARAMRAQDFLDPRETRTVQVLFVAVAALLLIACANVANLLMSRAWARRREFAVRVALGAGRARLARQMLTESMLLAVAGGILGVVVAWQTLRLIIALRPPALEHLGDLHVESAVLLWSAGISILTGVVFGCAPALLAGARSVGDVLRKDTRTGSVGAGARRIRSALIVLEIAMSLVLLVGAGLLVRSFAALQRMPLGFEPRGLLYADVMLIINAPRAERLPRIAAGRAALLARLRAIPGTTEATIGQMPGQGWGVMGGKIATDPDASGIARSLSAYSSVFIGPGFFRVARIPIAEGRLPDSTTWHQGMQQEVVVNRGFARRMWPDGRAVGSHLYTGGQVGESYTVVGVVDDIHMPGPHAAIKGLELYQPLPDRLGFATVLMRTTADATTIRRAINDVAPTNLIQSMTVGEAYLRDSLAPTRFAMALLAAFSVIALLLASVGLYGVIAYSVSQRTREIGVRVALGAEPRAVAALVVGSGARLTAAGVALGAIAGLASTRVLTNLLYGVSPADPATFLAIALLVVTIALLASYVPARRALRIDPTEALRAD